MSDLLLCLATSVPVFEQKKWLHLDSNLRVRYRMGSPNSSPLLATSKRSTSHFFKLSSIKVATRESRLLNFRHI